jgi:predicted DNA-binding protein YlxM (UPF0122 family)
MTKRPEILQRLVKEIDQALGAEDKLSLEGKSHALSIEWLTEYVNYLELWLTKGSKHYLNSERFYQPQALTALRQTIKTALRTAQLLRLSQPWKGLANKVTELATHPIDDFITGPQMLELHRRLDDLTAQAKELDKGTPSLMKLALRPVTIQALDPLEKLSNEIRMEERRRETEARRQAALLRYAAADWRLSEIGRLLHARMQALKSRRSQATQALLAFKQRLDTEYDEQERQRRLFRQFEKALQDNRVSFERVTERGEGVLLSQTPRVGMILHAGQVVLVDAAPEPRKLRRIYIQNGQIVGQDDHKQELFRTSGRLAGIQVTPEGQVRFFLTDRAYDAVIGWLEKNNKVTTSLKLWPERVINIEGFTNVLTGRTIKLTASPSAAPAEEDRPLAAKLKEAS